MVIDEVFLVYKKIKLIKIRNENGVEGMVPSSYVEQIEEAYQDVPADVCDDESFSSQSSNGKFKLTTKF